MDESISDRLSALELREAEVKRRESELWKQEHELLLESSRVRLQFQELAEEKRELNTALGQLLGYDKQQSVVSHTKYHSTNPTPNGVGLYSTINIAISAVNQRHNEEMTTVLAKEANLLKQIDELQVRSDYDQRQIDDANSSYATLLDKSKEREERLLYEISVHSHNEGVNHDRALEAEAGLRKLKAMHKAVQSAHQELEVAYARVEVEPAAPGTASDHDSNREEPEMEYVQLPRRNPPRKEKRVV